MAMDPFQARDWKNGALALLEKAQLAGFAEISSRPSAVELPALQQSGRQFDLVYVDGSHLFEDVFVDFYFSRFLLREGGVIAFDDCASPHVAKVLKFVTTSLTGQFKELNLAPFRLDQGRPFKYKLARVLRKTQLRAFQRIGSGERRIDSPFVPF